MLRKTMFADSAYHKMVNQDYVRLRLRLNHVIAIIEIKDTLYSRSNLLQVF